MDAEPELCPRVPRIGDIWMSPDLRYFVEVLRPVTVMPGMYVIRTTKARLEGIDVNEMPRLASLVKERYIWVTAVGDDPVLLDHAASCFKTGGRISAGDLVVDMNGSHGIVAYGDKEVRWFVPTKKHAVYSLMQPMPPAWPISFVCSSCQYTEGLHELGYMAHRGQMWRF